VAKSAQPSRTAPNRIAVFPRRTGTLRSARHSRRARIAYSVTCAHFRTTTRMIQIVFGDIPGFNQSKNGTMYRDVCSEDMRLVEPTNITPSQISSGSQYLRERRISVVATVLSWLVRIRCRWFKRIASFLTTATKATLNGLLR